MSQRSYLLQYTLAVAISVRISPVQMKSVGHACLLYPVFTLSQLGGASSVYTYLGLRINVDPMCLSLVIRGTGPVLVLRPVAGIGMVR